MDSNFFNSIELIAESQPNYHYRGTEDTENRLYTDGEYDYLFDFCGHIAIFNIRNSVRNAIKKFFREGHKFYYCNTKKQFILQVNRKTAHYLRHVIAAKIFGKQLRAMRDCNLKSLNGDGMDLRDSNIDGIKGEYLNCAFEIDGNKFSIKPRNSEAVFYTNSDAGLIKILKAQRWNFNTVNYRLKCYYPQLKQTFDLSAFVFGYYNMSMSSTNILSVLKKLKRRFEDGFVIDHLDDNPRNNQHWNLSLITATQNKEKRCIISQTVLPFIFNAVHFNGRYRVLMSHISELIRTDTKTKMKFENKIFEFDNAEKMIAYLRYWFNIYEVNGLTPKQHYEQLIEQDKKLLRYELTQMDFERLRDAQNVISDLPELITITERAYRKMVRACPPEMQKALSPFNPAVSSRVYAFVEDADDDS